MKLMKNDNCSYCGRDIGFFRRQKISDGYLCPECKKRLTNLIVDAGMDFERTSIAEIRDLEEATKLQRTMRKNRNAIIAAAWALLCLAVLIGIGQSSEHNDPGEPTIETAHVNEAKEAPKVNEDADKSESISSEELQIEPEKKDEETKVSGEEEDNYPSKVTLRDGCDELQSLLLMIDGRVPESVMVQWAEDLGLYTYSRISDEDNGYDWFKRLYIAYEPIPEDYHKIYYGSSPPFDIIDVFMTGKHYEGPYYAHTVSYYNVHADQSVGFYVYNDYLDYRGDETLEDAIRG